MARKNTRESGREVARRVLFRVLEEGAYTTLALDAELSRSTLPERERRLATELCYGVCRHLSRLDRAIASASTRGKVKAKPAVRMALRVGAYQLLLLDRVPAHAAVDDAVAAARRAAGPQVAGFVNSVLRKLARTGEPALPALPGDLDDAREYVRVACSMPDWLVERLAGIHGRGSELLAAAQAFVQRPPLAVRVNRLHTTRSELLEMLAREHPDCRVHSAPRCPSALLLEGLGDPASSPLFARGLFTVQDIGAQLVGHFVAQGAPTDPGQPLTILDACAGVGGKTTHLAEIFERHATIIAADSSARKLELSRQAAERLGVLQHLHMVRADLTRPFTPGDDGDDEDDDRGSSVVFSDTLARGGFDIAVLDAPCTGLGVMRRHPEAKWRVRESDIAGAAQVQRALLDHVSTLVRPGGLLFYSVCTFTHEEGLGQIASFVERHPEYALQAPEGALANDSADSADIGTDIMTTWPHRDQADAFFVARLRRG